LEGEHIPYGSPSNPIDDCGVVEIDLVSTEVHTEYEMIESPSKLYTEEAEHYDDYEAGAVAHIGEPLSSQYNNTPETEGELPIVIEENKAAINFTRNFELLNTPVTTMNSHEHRSTAAGKQANKVTAAPPPNQIQIFTASLTGKRLDTVDSFQPGNITVSRIQSSNLP